MTKLYRHNISSAFHKSYSSFQSYNKNAIKHREKYCSWAYLPELPENN